MLERRPQSPGPEGVWTPSGGAACRVPAPRLHPSPPRLHSSSPAPALPVPAASAPRDKRRLVRVGLGEARAAWLRLGLEDEGGGGRSARDVQCPPSVQLELGQLPLLPLRLGQAERSARAIRVDAAADRPDGHMGGTNLQLRNLARHRYLAVGGRWTGARHPRRLEEAAHAPQPHRVILKQHGGAQLAARDVDHARGALRQRHWRRLRLCVKRLARVEQPGHFVPQLPVLVPAPRV
mmetsp:Transcript_5512/g.18221  ORF Transcript_5512/g.18221 Transcript_5512/m.18221 type:complete len:236 (+) Transcript_5512:529-1236(+)